MSFPDPKSRPCTMRLKRRTSNHFVYETKRLPGQDNVGMEIYVPIDALHNAAVGNEVKFFVAFPEFTGSTVALSSGYVVRYNRNSQNYEMKLYHNEEWYPMNDGFTLTQHEWKLLTDLKNER